MGRRRKILLGVLAIASIAVGILLTGRLAQRTAAVDSTATDARPHEAATDGCDDLRTRYRALLTPLASCATDDECLAERRDGLPSGLDGCMRFRRRNAPTTEADGIERTWLARGCAKKYVTCGDRRAQCLDGQCRERPPDGLPRTSRRIDANGKFSFVAPPDLVQEDVRGEDSYVGQLTGPRYTLRWDYGDYGTSLEGDATVIRREKTTISGVKAELIASKATSSRRFYSGVQFYDIPAAGRGGSVRLTLWADCEKLEDCADIPIIARSIELY